MSQPIDFPWGSMEFACYPKINPVSYTHLGDADETLGTVSPKRVFIKPHVSYDLVIYGATRKRGFVKDNIPRLVPGSFGIAGLNFAPMYNFNNYFRAGLSVDCLLYTSRCV